MVLAISPYVRGADSHVYRAVGLGVIDEARVIQPWDEAKAKAALRDFLDEHRHKSFLYRLTLGPSEREVLISLFGVSPGDPISSYPARPQSVPSDLAKHGLRGRGPLAQAIGLSGAESMRIRKGDRVVEIQIGKNSTEFVSKSGHHYKLLHFHLNPPTSGVNFAFLSIYLISPTGTSISDSVEILTGLYGKVPVNALTLKIREDEWFVDDPEFPRLYPFLDALAPVPDWLDFTQSSSTTCVRSADRGRPIVCWANNAVP
jgi:hypothetical protein